MSVDVSQIVLPASQNYKFLASLNGCRRGHAKQSVFDNAVDTIINVIRVQQLRNSVNVNFCVGILGEAIKKLFLNSVCGQQKNFW